MLEQTPKCLECGGTELECPNFKMRKEGDAAWEKGDKLTSTSRHDRARSLPHRGVQEPSRATTTKIKKTELPEPEGHDEDR